MSDRNDIFNAPLIQDGKILAPLSSGRANVSIGEIARHVAQHATGLMADELAALVSDVQEYRKRCARPSDDGWGPIDDGFGDGTLNMKGNGLSVWLYPDGEFGPHLSACRHQAHLFGGSRVDVPVSAARILSDHYALLAAAPPKGGER